MKAFRISFGVFLINLIFSTAVLAKNNCNISCQHTFEHKFTIGGSAGIAGYNEPSVRVLSLSNVLQISSQEKNSAFGKVVIRRECSGLVESLNPNNKTNRVSIKSSCIDGTTTFTLG